MPIVTFNFWTAKRYLRAGWWARRLAWDGEDLAWVSYWKGLYFYHNGAAVRVVEAYDVGRDDMRAEDWTLQGPEDEDLEIPPLDQLEPEPPQNQPGGTPPTRDPSRPNAGKSNSSQPGGGSGGSGGDEDGAPSGGGGGVGGGGGGSPTPPQPPSPKPAISNPSLTLSATTLDVCSDAEEGEEDETNVTVNLSLGAAPGAAWCYKVALSTPSGDHAQLGTVPPGSGTAVALNGVKLVVGRPHTVIARAYLPNSPYSAVGTTTVTFAKCGGGGGGSVGNVPPP